jgi:hypothetical protein
MEWRIEPARSAAVWTGFAALREAREALREAHEKVV